MSGIRIFATSVAICIYIGICWFYGIGPALLSMVIWVLGCINGREEYLEESRRD